jgi:FKBP-type peptidyl-prolyl cis-trans isomerase
MKHLVYLFSVVLLASCGNGNVKLSTSATMLDSVSYAIGVFEAYSSLEHIQSSELEGVDHNLLLAGYKSIALNDDSVKAHTRQWASEVINRYFIKKMEDQKEKDLKEGATFLENNKDNDGVTVLSSGLQYKVIREGTGISPEISDTVNFIYTGTFVDGTTFDSSKGNPVKIPLAQLIKGWQEGLPLMKEGAQYIFYIPSDLAYSGGQLVGKTLIFDVELISVHKGAAKKPAER